jgi:hypothetical protein
MSIRHDCKTMECYKEVCIPDWEIFDGILPRGIRFSDVDGWVCLHTLAGGFILFAEWKRKLVNLADDRFYAQRQGFIDFTLNRPDRQFVLLIYGPLREPQHCQMVINGKLTKSWPCDRESLRNFVGRWSKYVKAAA